jgi:hypothetical protein
MAANKGANAPMGTTTAVYTDTSNGSPTPHPLNIEGNHSNHEYAKVTMKNKYGFLSVCWSINLALLGSWNNR